MKTSKRRREFLLPEDDSDADVGRADEIEKLVSETENRLGAVIPSITARPTLARTGSEVTDEMVSKMVESICFPRSD